MKDRLILALVALIVLLFAVQYLAFFVALQPPTPLGISATVGLLLILRVLAVTR